MLNSANTKRNFELSFCGKKVYYKKRDVETMDKCEKLMLFSQAYYLLNSLSNIELINLSTNTYVYYYYYYIY